MYEFLLVFGVVLWLAIGFMYVRKPIASMYHPLTFYLMVHGLIFVVRPLLAYYYDYQAIYNFYEFYPSMDEKITALAGADLGLIAFAIACMKFGNIPIDFKNRSEFSVMDSIVVRSFMAVCIILLPVGVYSLSSALRGTAGLMEMDAATGITYSVSGNGYFYDMQLMVGPICVAFAWVFRFRIWAFLPFLGYLAAKASTGGRGPFVQAFIALCLIYFFQKHKKWPDAKIIAPVLAILAIFQAVGTDREAIRNIFTGNAVATGSVSSADKPFESMDYANMEFFEYLTHVIPNRSGTHGYFLDNLQIFTEPVPRALWKSKPLGPPIQLYDLMDYGHPLGMTSSVPGEGWAQGGWIGIVLWCSLFGGFYGWIYSVFVRSRQTVAQVALYLIFISATVVTYRDGVLLTILKSSLFTLMPLIFWGFLINYNRSRQQIRSKNNIGLSRRYENS